jgi:hypothetical protein
LLVLVGIVVLVFIVGGTWGSGKRALAIVWASIILVPYWIGLPIATGVSAFLLVVLVLLLAQVLPRAGRLSWNWRDALVVFMGLSATALGVAGVSSTGDAGVVVVQWIAAYFLGRYIGLAPEQEIGRVAVVALVVISCLAILEFVTDFHPFANIGSGTRAYEIWSPIQYRGGTPRSEWTSGHSIALGGLVALNLPLVQAAGLPSTRAFWISALSFAAVCTTFSRLAIVSAVAAIALTFLFMHGYSLSRRIGALAGVVIVVAVVYPLLADVYLRAAGETAASNEARFRMLELLPLVRVFGAAGNAIAADAGRIGYAGDRGLFRTVDNTFLLAALQFGWIFGVLLAVIVFSFAALFIRASSVPSVVAVAAFSPFLVGVAMITHLGTMYWILAGMAVTMVQRRLVESRPGATTLRFGRWW